VKRLVALLAAVVALAVGVGAVAAADGAGVQTRTVSFVLNTASCGNLAPGTSIMGSGTERSITTVRTDRHDVTTISNYTYASGTADDGHGNIYVFHYRNRFRVTNSAASPAVFTGKMRDAFSLDGDGPAGRLSNGFFANVTFQFNAAGEITSASFAALLSRGDPIDFSTGVAHCDPL
jgi:hypothetical protein